MSDIPNQNTNPDDEVIQEESTNTNLQVNNPQEKLESIMRLENLINSHLADLEIVQKSLKEQNVMLKDAFENDAEYSEVQEKSNEIQKLKKTVKDRIIEDPSVALLSDKVADLRAEVKETQIALSDYLSQYFQESGLRQITGTDGEIREIVTTVKLVKMRG
ncbi:MAG: hypothetical protein Q8P72_05830 [Candidatus Roizmanbacteria bacterium]|nr:hypothetical protein [Candidatus Roizmanbacteria bacterium]